MTLEKKVQKYVGKICKRNVIDHNKTISYGRQYGSHIASKPYSGPNIRTGNLVGSTRYLLGTNSVYIIQGSVYAIYSEYLENGTGKMDPRPNIKRIPNDKRFLQILERGLADFLKREAEEELIRAITRGNRNEGHHK